jgi:hypothetical protein
MTDKSFMHPLVGKLIISLLRDEQKVEGAKLHYIIGQNEEDKTFLAAVEYEDEKPSIVYTLGWQTAAFIGYCLIQTAIKEAGYDVVISYLHSLADRRKEIVKWMDDVTRLFRQYRKKGG